jgi:terminase small subunit-like protein
MSGRPPCYTAELAQRVLDALSAGRTLGEVCGEDAMPCEVTVRKWVQEDVDGFAARYRRARQIGLTAAPGQVRNSAEIADQVIDALMIGQPLSEVCKDQACRAKARSAAGSPKTATASRRAIGSPGRSDMAGPGRSPTRRKSRI